jgi:hypothetical protein
MTVNNSPAPQQNRIIVLRDEAGELLHETAANGAGKTDPRIMAEVERLVARIGRGETLSRALVLALDRENTEENRRAWRNITRPADADPLWMSEHEPKQNTSTVICMRVANEDDLRGLFGPKP